MKGDEVLKFIQESTGFSGESAREILGWLEWNSDQDDFVDLNLVPVQWSEFESATKAVFSLDKKALEEIKALAVERFLGRSRRSELVRPANGLEEILSSRCMDWLQSQASVGCLDAVLTTREGKVLVKD